ncbi:unnamed protein product [Allacma fusca]|uniref:Thioredoxin domain-containing protein n=1 Tax=Allacma fusca TaxID=39272 RepID=A0A8J2JA05_9HEXA|nr:unnamed protein product [Allacma fusca]
MRAPYQSVVTLVTLILCCSSLGACAKSKSEGVIEDVNGKGLAKLLEEKDYVAVFWYTKSCKQCDKVLEELEKIDDASDQFGVDFVKINDKRIAKTHGVEEFPALIYFRNKEPVRFTGDLENEQSVLDFLTSLESMDNPDRIEEVNSKILDKIIHENNFVAVLFCRSHAACREKNTPDCRKCEKALRELENIDDEADELGIAFVKINDDELADEYNLVNLPRLVYYRNEIPIVYDGDLMREEDVLEWLISNKSTGDEDEEIELVSFKALSTLVESVDHLAVLFFDKSVLSSGAIKELENIDDDCGRVDIQFVKTDDRKAMKEYGIDDTPRLVYFENRVPNVYDGDLRDEDSVLKWLLHQKASDEIEDVTDEMLDRLIRESKHLAVLFYDADEKESREVLAELENIDDECDEKGILFVKIDDLREAAEYGIEDTPQLVYFENGIPSMYHGDLTKEDLVLKWLIEQLESDEIEEVTNEMLNMLVQNNQQLAVLFYDKEQRKSQKIVQELETIDDECDAHGIIFVKISDETMVKELGISMPSLVYFENRIPHLFEGDLTEEDQVLTWLVHQLGADEIEEVTDEMLDQLISGHPYVAALFYDKDDKTDMRTLLELENIDDECDAHGIVFVKIDDDNEAKEYGFEELPVLVYFENKVPSVYEGDLNNEEQVLQWLLEQRNSDTIEEVTDEMLVKLINTHQYVAVYFSGPCKSGASCYNILQELESLDDDADEAGIQMVTTEETDYAKSKLNLKTFPILVLFRNGEPLIYKGDLSDEDEVLSWLTDDDSLELPDRIEEVNLKMLQRLLETTEFVCVFFYRDADKKSQRILLELENIDDEADDLGIAFVKISDEGMLREYDLDPLPALVFFRAKFPMIYAGDLAKEEVVLEWLITLKNADRDTIEEVDHRTLRMLLDELDHVAVLFYEDNCGAVCDSVLKDLETIDDDADDVGIQLVKTTDTSVAEELRVTTFPALVYYQGGAPSIYKGDLTDEDRVINWMKKVKAIYSESTGDLDDDEYNRCVELTINRDTAITYNCCPAHIDVCEGKSGDAAVRRKGRTEKESDLLDEGGVLTWLVHNRKFEALVEINRVDLEDLIGDSDYLAVMFFSNTSDRASGRALRRACLITEDAATFGIPIARMSDPIIAKKYGIRNLPGLALFRKGHHIIYEDDLEDEEEMLDWLTAPENMILKDQIEVVNRKMLDRMRETTDHLAVLFFSETECKQCEKVLQSLEEIDDEADDRGIAFVRIDDWDLAKSFGVHALPALLYFRLGSEDPVIFTGDLRSSQRILDWLSNRKDPTGVSIVEVNGDELKNVLAGDESVVVYFYNKTRCTCEVEKLSRREKKKLESENENLAEIEQERQQACAKCAEIIEKLENVDDEVARHGVKLVKTYDTKFAVGQGVGEFPALVYFEEGVASVYEGELTAEEDVLHWIVEHKTEERIELVTRGMLESLVVDAHYLAVFFYKQPCRACDSILMELEKIDDECDMYGIHMVKIADPILAKRYGITTFPALLYFRNGNPLLFEGDLRLEEAVLEWLTNDENRELADEIEAVNSRMLEKLVGSSPFLVVFFYDEEECGEECDNILLVLEEIDDEADAYGIDMVKVTDGEVAADFAIMSIPTLAYFRRGHALIYEGDLMDSASILGWITSNEAFQLKDEIELVNRRMLDKILEEQDFVAVYFFDSDPEACPTCAAIHLELERIDHETDNLDILFIRIDDSKYGKKWGLTDVPSLVYFRKKFPSIYRGDLMDEESVLYWLQKNRYRQPELNLFMYGLFSMGVGFIVYTIFILFCLKT